MNEAESKKNASNLPPQESVVAPVVDAFSIVMTPPVTFADKEEDGELSPKKAMCNWCRRNVGDCWLEGWAVCFDCIEIIIERENATAILDKSPKLKVLSRTPEYFDASYPDEWRR